ncbi:MAG: hypothetical protein V4510_12875 [bacterium]
MKDVDLKDAAVRAVKTFVAAAVPLLAGVPALVSTGQYDTLPATFTAAGLAGSAAVITFVWNALLDYSRK